MRKSVLEGLAGYHLRRASIVVSSGFALAVEGTGIRQSLFAILAVIGANPDISQSEVGRSLGILRANMVSLINQLVEAGLVDRRTVSHDRRAFALTLTPPGDAMLKACLARIEASEERLLADLSADERNILIVLLSRIAAHER